MSSTTVETVRNIILSECLNDNRIREGDLGKKLGLSRTPIREILRHLEEEGMIVRKRKTGITLHQPTLQEVVAIYDMRAVLEGLACRLVAGNMDPDVLKKIAQANADFDRVKFVDPIERRARDIAFHHTILENCGNKYVARSVDNLNILTASFQLAHKILPRSVNRKTEKYPHAKVVEALKSGDAKMSEQMMCLHIEERKNTIIRFVLGSSIGSDDA